MKIRTWRELVRLETFEERYRYLMLKGEVGHSTFGQDRYLNQRFYTSREWRDLRHEIIARDLGCDMALEGYPVHERITIHHMNPLTIDDILDDIDYAMDPEYLVCVSHRTHNAIHYGDDRIRLDPVVERRSGDTLLW